MSNLKILGVRINLEIEDDDLIVKLDLNSNDEFVCITDANSSERLVIPASDLPGFVQEFLYHSRNLSTLSKDKSITEIKIVLLNSNRDCYMRMESEICVFPNKRYSDGGRSYEVRIAFENMQTIISALNSFT